MTGKPLAAIAGLVLASAALAGCSSGSDAQPAADAATPGEESTAPSAAPAGDSGGDSGSSAGTGSATLVVGDTTYEFDNFVCAFGYENTQSDTYSFSSNSIQEIDGVKVQMQLDVADRSGSDSLTGDAVVQGITVNDIEDFENPAIAIGTSTLDATFDGDTISAEGTFYDEVADPSLQEELPGTFEATCGAGSLR